MSNILAALLGGAGAGAQSYGGSLQREQEQQRMQMQRMAEMQQQEAARRRLAMEDDERASALKLQTRTAGVNSIRALHPDAQIPDGDFDASVLLRSLEDRARDKRFNEGQSGQMDRLERNLGGRLEQIEKQGGISRGIAEMGNTSRAAIAAMAEAGRDRRNTPDAPGKDPQADWITKRATGLLGTADSPGVSIEEATRQAQRDASVLFGKPPSSAPPAPAGATMMRGLGVQTPEPSPLSANDRARAASDPKFAAWLASKGYRL